MIPLQFMLLRCLKKENISANLNKLKKDYIYICVFYLFICIYIYKNVKYINIYTITTKMAACK